MEGHRVEPAPTRGVRVGGPGGPGRDGRGQAGGRAGARRGADRKTDLWTTANVVQENVIKGGVGGISATTGRRMKTRAINSVGEDVRLNRALWSLTERMAELVS